MVVYTKHENIIRLLITEMIKKKKWHPTKKLVDMIYKQLTHHDTSLGTREIKMEIEKLLTKNILHFSKFGSPYDKSGE